MRRISETLDRLKKARARRGLVGTGKQAIILITRRFFFNETIIYKFDEASPRPKFNGSLLIQPWRSWAEIPNEIQSALTDWEGSLFPDQVTRALEIGGTFWTGIHNDRVLAYQWSRKGNERGNWYVDLKDDDFVLFSIVTHPDARGQGVAPHMMRHIIEEQIKPGYYAYIDCKEWNKASQNSIMKTGFREISRK